MQTSYAPLSTQIISDGLDVSVTSAYGGAGQLVDLSNNTDSVRIWNQDTNFGVEYQIDSGNGQIPSQLRIDPIHQSGAGQLAEAEFYRLRIAALGWDAFSTAGTIYAVAA